MTIERYINQINKDGVKKLSEVKLPDDIRKKLTSLLKREITAIKGRPFYYILNAVTNDFEVDADKGFEEYFNKKKRKPKVESKTGSNKYKDFIKQFLVSQQDVSHKAKIDNTRFSKIINRDVTDFLAYEVYAIAKSQGVDIKKAFEQLYKE